MRIAQTLFQTHNSFAIGGKTEMPGFDNARMDRTDGNLVNPLTINHMKIIRDIGF